MASFIIRGYGDDAPERYTTHKLKYTGTAMGDSYVEVQDISVNEPIPWHIGDYIDYRGERFVMSVLPTVKRQARNNSYGAAIVYSNVRFRSMMIDILSSYMMLDCTLDDNNLHYTYLPTFSFYCGDFRYIDGGVMRDWSEGVQQLADRIKANWDRCNLDYPLTVNIENGTYISNPKSISISNQTIWNALVGACKELDINFTARITTSGGGISGCVITLGARMSIAGSEWRYGKGNGLIALTRQSNTEQGIITALRAYGSERNLPYRYYNNLWRNEHIGEQGMVGPAYIYYQPTTEEEMQGIDEIEREYGEPATTVTFERVASASMYLPRLMLPAFRLSGAQNAYISDNTAMAEYGYREGVVIMDSDTEETKDIYPSIEGMTTTILWDSLTQQEREEQGLADDQDHMIDQGSLDEVKMCDTVDFSGIIPEQSEDSPTFEIIIGNIGFDPNEQIISGEDAYVSFKSGALAGRDCRVQKVSKSWTNVEIGEGRYQYQWLYHLTLEVCADTSINQYFPNVNYQVEAGDKFVLLGIRMPDVYIRVAETRLAVIAESWLDENSQTNYTYKPEMDNIYLANNSTLANQIKEGVKMHIVDAGLSIDETLPISSLTITEGDAEIAKYDVVLSEEISGTFIERATKAISAQLGAVGFGGSLNSSNVASIQRMLLDLPNQYISKKGADKASGPLTINTNLTADYIQTSGYYLGDGSRMGYSGIVISNSVSSEGDGTGVVPFAEQSVNYIITENTGEVVQEETIRQVFSLDLPSTGVLYFGTSTIINGVSLQSHIVKVKSSNQQNPVYTQELSGGQASAEFLRNNTHQCPLDQGDAEYTVEYTVRYTHSTNNSAGLTMALFGMVDGVRNSTSAGYRYGGSYSFKTSSLSSDALIILGTNGGGIKIDKDGIYTRVNGNDSWHPY